MLVLISGISASGKNTVISKLKERHPEWGSYVSYTTKPKIERKIDNDDQGYFYVSKAEFEKMIADDKLMEFAEVHGNYYGTGKKELEEAMKNHEIVINDLDVIGTQKLKEKGVDLVSVFINVSDNEILRKRLYARGDSESDIEKRLSRADMEREYMSIYDYVVDNIVLDTCVNKIDGIINKEKSKRITKTNF